MQQGPQGNPLLAAGNAQIGLVNKEAQAMNAKNHPQQAQQGQSPPQAPATPAQNSAPNSASGLSDFQLQALVQHYNMPLDPPQQYQDVLGHLDNNHYQTAIQQMARATDSPALNNYNQQAIVNNQVGNTWGPRPSLSTSPATVNQDQQQYWQNTLQQPQTTAGSSPVGNLYAQGDGVSE